MAEFVETYAYCLMPNHFHLLVKIKPKDSFPAKTSPDFPTAADLREQSAGAIVAERFRRCLMGYSKAINKQQNRTGSLFQKVFKRKEVNNDRYFTQLIHYIHRQPSHHGFVHLTDEDYPWSSYPAFLSEKPTRLQRTQVMDWFGDKAAFVRFHRQNQDLKTIRDWMIEEE
mgnify:FL=1